jgi:hypothetical protein
LTGVNSTRVISCPEILRICVSIVPPGISDAVELKRGVETIVLEKLVDEKKVPFYKLNEIYTLID